MAVCFPLCGFNFSLTSQVSSLTMAGSSRKRTIDLTAGGDDDVQFISSQPRKTPRLPDLPIGNSNGDEEFDEEFDESILDEIIDPSQQYNDRAFIQFMLYGIHASLTTCRTLVLSLTQQARSTRRLLASGTTEGMRPLMRWSCCVESQKTK